MRGLRLCLTPFAPDQSGVVSVLYEMGGLVVIVDAGGCAGNVCGFDEPRWRTTGSAVFSAGLRDIDAILGRDDLLIEKVVRAVGQMDVSFVALVGTPVPAVLGTDFRALARTITRKVGLPCVAVASSGMRLYDKGAERAWTELFKTFASREVARVEGRVGVIGLTPLDFAAPQGLRERVVGAGGAREALLFGYDDGQGFASGSALGDVRLAGTCEKNFVVAPQGLAAARWLEREFGTPFEVCDPLASDLLAGVDVARAERVLVVHQAVAARTLASEICAQNADVHVTCATWFTAPAEVGECAVLREEDDFVRLVQDEKPDVIVADSVLAPLVPSFVGMWVDAKHFAVSGRL